MSSKIPFWFYRMLSAIVKKGGWVLVAVVIALIGQGTIKTLDDLKKWLEGQN